MRFSLAFILAGTACAFQLHPRLSSSRTTLSFQRSQTEDYLQELATEWDSLITRVQEFDDEPMDESTGKELTEGFLKNAIEKARRQEQIEEEHLMQAHREYEEALKEEYRLEVAIPLMPDNPDYWMDPSRFATRLHENGTLMEKPIYQYLTTDVAPLGSSDDMPGPLKLVEGYPAIPLEKVHEKEVYALEEESEAKRTLEELKKNEEVLLQTLRGFEALQKQQQETLEDLKKSREERIQRNRLLNELS